MPSSDRRKRFRRHVVVSVVLTIGTIIACAIVIAPEYAIWFHLSSTLAGLFSNLALIWEDV
jgi:hypothetical protein